MRYIKIYGIFFMLLIMSNTSFAEPQVIKVRNSKRAVIKFGEEDFIKKGDTLLLQDQSKDKNCLVKILKAKTTHALISTKKCLFKVEKGNSLIHIDSESDEIGRDISSLESKDKTSKIEMEEKEGMGYGLFKDSFFEFHLGFERKHQWEAFTYPVTGKDLYDSLKIDESATDSIEADLSIYSSKRREFELDFGIGRASWDKEFILKKGSEKIGSFNTKYSWLARGIGGLATPIIPSLKLRPLVGFFSIRGNRKEKTGSNEGKVNIVMDSIVYGIHYDLEEKRTGSFLRLYFNENKIKIDNQKTESGDINLDFRYSFNKKKKNWFDLSYSLDTDESKNWDVAYSHRSDMIAFSLSYRNKVTEYSKHDDTAELGVGIDFYFGD